MAEHDTHTVPEAERADSATASCAIPSGVGLAEPYTLSTTTIKPNLRPRDGDATAEASTRAIRRRVLDLALPAVAEMAFSSFIQVINLIMVGRVGPAAVAAVGITTQPVFLALAVFQALNVGATAMVARAIGADNPEEANEVTRQTILINVLLAIAFSVLGYVFSRDLVLFMGAGPDIVDVATRYCQIIMATLAFNTLTLSINSTLRGSGDTRTPMRVNMTADALVVVFGFPLIYGMFGLPALGAVGAAVAAGMARFVAFCLAASTIMSGKHVLRFSLKGSYKLNWGILRRIANLGLPAAGEQMVFRTGFTILTKVMAGLGTEGFAAHQIVQNIMNLTMMPGQGLGVAATTLVGQNLGAKRPREAERSGWEAHRFGVISSVTLIVLFFTAAPLIMRLYTNDAVVIAAGVIALQVGTFGLIGQTDQQILSGGLRGAGDTVWPFVSTLVTVLGLRVVLAVVFVHGWHWGVKGAWAAFDIDQSVRAVFIYARFRSGRWKTRRV